MPWPGRLQGGPLSRLPLPAPTASCSNCVFTAPSLVSGYLAIVSKARATWGPALHPDTHREARTKPGQGTRRLSQPLPSPGRLHGALTLPASCPGAVAAAPDLLRKKQGEEAEKRKEIAARGPGLCVEEAQVPTGPELSSSSRPPPGLGLLRMRGPSGGGGEAVGEQAGICGLSNSSDHCFLPGPRLQNGGTDSSPVDAVPEQPLRCVWSWLKNVHFILLTPPCIFVPGVATHMLRASGVGRGAGGGNACPAPGQPGPQTLRTAARSQSRGQHSG